MKSLPRLALPTTSIKTRAALVAVVIVLATTFLLAAIGQRLYLQDRRSHIAEEQLGLTAQAATALDQKFIARALLLRSVAESVPDELLRRPGGLQDFLQRHIALGEAFDNVGMLDAAGDVVASMTSPQNIGRVNVADRAYFINTLREARGFISQPLRGRVSGRPQVVMTQPVLDRQRRVVYVITGSFDLQASGFFAEVARQRVGKTGFMFIIDSSGVVVEHPQRERIMVNVADEPGQNPATTRALAGFDGAVEGKTRAGVPALLAYRHMQQADWIVGSVVPLAEAYEPLAALQRDLVLGALLLAAVFGGITWLAVRVQFGALHTLHERMRAAHEDPDYVAVPSQHAQDEIGKIASAFDQLLLDRQASQKQLRDSETYVRNVLANATDAFVACDAQGNISEWNRQAEQLFGWRRAEVIGRALSGVLVPPALRPAHIAGMRRFAESGSGPIVNRRVHMRALHREGHEVPVEMAVTGVRVDGAFTACAFLRDMSGQEEAESRLAESEKRLHMIADHLPALVAYLDRDLRYQFANEGYRRLYGLDPQAMLGRTAREVFGDDVFQNLEPYLRRAFGGTPVHEEFRSARTLRPGHISLHYLPDHAADGSVQGLYVMGLDITERRDAEQKLAASEQRLRTITDNLPALISYIDSERILRFCNATYEKWMGLRPADAVGKPIAEVFGPTLYGERHDYVERALAGKAVEFELNSNAKGVTRHLQVAYVPDLRQDGTVAGIYTIGMDISRQKEVERQLILQARFDTLTGLPNRAQLEERLAEAVARSRRTGHPLAVLFLDIDHFKSINDSQGHGAGDAVLVEFAHRLQGCMRLNDVAARLAGDEFIVVVEDLRGAAELETICTKILEVMRAPWEAGGHSLQVTASIGAAWVEAQKPAPAELLAIADGALYVAKNGGRNQFHIERC